MLYGAPVSGFPYRVTRAQAVAAVLATVRADPAFVAGCLVVNGAHGYTMELEYLQRIDGTTQYSAWSDIQGIISTEERDVSIDLAAELPRLCEETAVETRLPDPGNARYVLIVLANRERGTWVETPTPLDGQPRADGALGRILQLVFPS